MDSFRSMVDSTTGDDITRTFPNGTDDGVP
jgi:hypothetical protein